MRSRSSGSGCPAWHLVQALNTLIDEKGDPAIDNYMDDVRPLSAAESKMLDDAAQRSLERQAHWNSPACGSKMKTCPRASAA
jgi:hypothetical protein